MTEEADFSTELRDSVDKVLGLKLHLKVKVQLEVKDKLENRILVVTPHRLYLVTARVPVKVEESMNILQLQGVSSHTHTQLLLEHDRGSWSLRSALEVDLIIAHIGLSLQKICPGVAPAKLLKKLSLKPAERSAALLDRWSSAPELGPCGGFSLQYWCVCDHFGLPYRDEVQWDVDTIYLSQDSTELNLQDFIHLEPRDLVPIVAVLEHNMWFTKLSVKDYKLSSEVCDQIVRVVARSSRLEELLLDNAALRSDFAQRLSSALAQNPASVLHSLCLCNNSLDDKGVSVLSSQLAKLPLGLKVLNLSRTNLTPKGVNSVSQALSSNPACGSCLKVLDLSGNSLKGDELQNLQTFLAQSNSLETLDLSHSDCSLEQICSSLLRGSLQHLSVLNLSKCVFSHRKCKEISTGFKLFFSSAHNLSHVSMSGTRLPLEALKALLLGLGCNPRLRDVSLDLSCCELRSSGAQVLEGCIAEIPNITSLDISDNGLDMDLLTLLVWISKNRSIRHLNLGKNFSSIRSRNLSQVLDHVVQLIQEEDSPLASLSLVDSRLKAELSVVLNALGSNASLVELDVSGNSMGDVGAKALAKALQINTKLRTIMWDRNNVSPQGLQDVASALEKNYTIRFMPVPIVDAAQALKVNPEKTEDALLKMEQFLLRNHETRRYLQEQVYRLQQGIVSSTTQQVMDSVCVKVQDHLNSLRFCESATVQQEVTRAKNLMKDARSSKTLLPSLYHLQNSASLGPCAEALHDTLESMAGEVFRVMDQQLQCLLEQMVASAQTLCPHVMQKNTLRRELLLRGTKRRNISQSFIHTTLLEQSGVDLANKISEVKLDLASFLSDRIVDEILESLSESQLSLSRLLKRGTGPLEKDPPSEPEVIDETELHQEAETQEVEAALDRKLTTDSDSSLMKSKRRSILVRMLRPVSVAFEMEFDLDKALEEVPIHEEDPPPATPLAGAKAPPLLPEPVQIQTLDHQTKSRPRPKKRSRPSRSRRVAAPSAGDSDNNSFMEKVDEGIDDFFHKTVSKLSLRRPATRDAEKEPKSGFFHCIKSPTSRSEKAAIAPPAGHEEEPGPETHKEPEQTEEIETPEDSDSGPEARAEEGPDAPPAPAAPAAPARAEEKPDAPPAPARPRHMGVPVLGAGLMAEMKAKLAHKSEVKGHTPHEPDALPPADAQEPRPEPAPRSRATASPASASGPESPASASGPESPASPSGPESPASPSDTLAATPLPTPRLKRAESEQSGRGSVSSVVDGESAFEAPVAVGKVGAGGRTWSSMKRSLSAECEASDERQRAKSLPHYTSLVSRVCASGSAEELSATCRSEEEQAPTGTAATES